jgi:5-formyltetrahydrofolate cyclo-ligase
VNTPPDKTGLADKADLADKTGLRQAMRARRRDLARAQTGAADRAAGNLPLASLPAFACFSGYRPMGSELDPGPLMRRLAATGATPSLPAAGSRDGPLVFRAWAPDDPLSPDAAGVPAPPASAPVVAPDLVIAPLLAFDRAGGRLGQGAGHYDRTLANLRAARPVFVLGLAYAGQELDHVPTEPHDQRLDAILTETGYIEVG